MATNYETAVMDKKKMATVILATRDINDLPKKFIAGSIFHHVQCCLYADSHVKFFQATNDFKYKARATVQRNIEIFTIFATIVFRKFDDFKYEQRELGNMLEPYYTRDLSDIDTDDVVRTFGQLARQSLGIHIDDESPFEEGDENFANASLLHWWFVNNPVRITRGDKSTVMNVSYNYLYDCYDRI